MRNKKGNVAVIAIIVVIVAITAGVVGWLFARNTQAPAPQAVTTQPIKAKPTTPATQPETATNNTTQGNNAIAQQLKIKFSLDILKFWGVKEAFQYPKNPYIFYYITEDSTGFSIGKFDASKDKNYLQDKNPNIPQYNEFVYNEKLSKGNEFRGVGFDEDKFVFTETSEENSPGPCFSPWLYNKLSYIDINSSKIEKRPYTVSAQKLQQVNNEAAYCQKNL